MVITGGYGYLGAAMIEQTKYYAVLLGKFNIQVNAIALGNWFYERQTS